MNIAICGSMAFTEKLLETKALLEKRGHVAVVTSFAQNYLGTSGAERETLVLHDKLHHDAILEFWGVIKQSDAILVLNYDRKGIKNYIGGNTFMEIGFAYVLGKKIFLLNPVPDIEYYKSEIEAVKPIILNGNLDEIR
jgi:hypothetical protein